MMNKKLLFVTLVLAIGFVSCQKNEIDVDRLVDVELYTAAPTKSEVNSGGSTSWAVLDEVFVLDENGMPRTFINTAETSESSSKFAGKLLAGRGIQTYYAYHSALNNPCTLNGYNITVTREDLGYLSDDNFNAIRKGEYCSMVALPISFDAEKPLGQKSFNFHHINCLIEARISTEGAFGSLEFDKVVYTLTAIQPNEDYPEYNDLMPFNKNVTVNLKQITPNPASIPYIEGSEKVNKLTSVITYPKVVTLFERRTSETQKYDLPMYALPTKAKFTYQYDIVFYKGEEKVRHLRRQGIADGLNLAGMHDPSFDKTHIVNEP